MAFRKEEVALPETRDPKEIVKYVYDALKAKGHDPVMQLVGYIMSGDPTYITGYRNARTLIMRVERDDILEEIVSSYVKGIDG